MFYCDMGFFLCFIILKGGVFGRASHLFLSKVKNRWPWPIFFFLKKKYLKGEILDLRVDF